MRKHGIDCGCWRCKRIRSALRKAEKEKKISLVGTPEDLKKIRNEDSKSKISGGVNNEKN